MSMRPLYLALTSLACLSGHALAQSINIDLGIAGGAPASTFGGAAGQPGFWNNITVASNQDVTLNRLNGTITSATLTRTITSAGSYTNNANASLTGDYAALLCDVQSAPSLSYTITGLEIGTYLVYTYALDANSAATVCNVTVPFSYNPVAQDSGGVTLSSNDFGPKRTHSLHFFNLGPAGDITINVTPTSGTNAQVAGIQVVKIGNALAKPRFYVNDNASGDNTGATWASAFHNLSDALESARRAGAYNEVWAAAGTYKATSGTDRSAKFVMPSHVKLYGGFAGTESSLSQRTMPTNAFQTVLSGSIGASNDDTDNSYVVMDASSTDSDTLIDGISIARGYNNSAAGRGGGMLLNGGFAVLQRVRFLRNYAGVTGGALSITGGGPTLLDCYFFQNDSGGSAGAIYIANTGTTLDLDNCEFIGNFSLTDGGAISTSNAGVRAVNCLFTGNNTGIAGYGGALRIAGNNVSTITSSFSNCSFTNNRCYQGGGAVYALLKSQANFYNSILWNDEAILKVSTNETGVDPASLSFTSFTNTTLEGAAGLDGLNPIFVNALGSDGLSGTTDDNLRLSPGSPCIDSGRSGWIALDVLDYDDDNVITEAFPVDLDLHARQSDVLGAADGANAGTPPVDRGCYELQMPDCLADLTHDGLVDLLDYFAFFNAFDQNIAAADVDLSGQTDLNDYFLFFNSFDAGC